MILPRKLRIGSCTLHEMIERGERVLLYTHGLERDDFIADWRTYDATLRNIELIGEHADNIPDHVHEAHPEIPWRQIIGTRHRVIHGSMVIDDDVIWDIIQTDVPDLLPKLRRLLDSDTQVQP